VEALLGAGLVIFRKVAHDQSIGRAWYLAAHLTNTMLLLAALTLTAWMAWGGVSRLRIRSASAGLLWAALVTVLISITGAVTALGDMLFPSGTLMEGVRRDFLSASPVLLRLRVAHPAVAILGAAFIIWMALGVLRNSESAGAKRAAGRLIGLTVFQLFWGAANLSLLAPIWMQLTHLLAADVVWIAMVVTVAESAVTVREFRTEFLSAIGDSAGKAAAGNPA